MSDGFLGRWSRLKRDAARPATVPVAPVEPDLPVALAPDSDLVEAELQTELDADPVDDTSDRASPEDIAALPHPDELTPEADLAPFLRKGVPDLLRKAALRRMWSVDPTIRDAIGDARDYAYDWNVAGGVPGFSPLAADFDAAGLVERMFKKDAETEPANTEGSADLPSLGEDDPGHTNLASTEGLREPTAQAPEASSNAESESMTETFVVSEAAPDGLRAGGRRHGGAVPN